MNFEAISVSVRRIEPTTDVLAVRFCGRELQSVLVRDAD